MTQKEVLRRLYDALATLIGDPEDCDDCSDLDSTDDPRPCRLHASVPLYTAIKDAEEALGPCICGHTASGHFDEDTTRCKYCGCGAFRLPKMMPSDPRERERP